MNLLIDSNVPLEIILNQERAGEAREFLSHPERYNFFISDFSLHSVGLFLFYRKQMTGFRFFLNDIVGRMGMQVKALGLDDMESLIKASENFNLDFDDAYQYVVAEKYGLTLVSFDSDFDRTPRGRKTTTEVLADEG